MLNCSSHAPFLPIVSASSCVSVYHYRGVRSGGYFFTLHIVAGYGNINKNINHIDTNINWINKKINMNNNKISEKINNKKERISIR